MATDDTPATQKDLRELESRLVGRIDLGTENLKRYFDVAVEQIRHDLLGANRDQMELLKDKANDHEARLVALERPGRR